MSSSCFRLAKGVRRPKKEVQNVDKEDNRHEEDKRKEGIAGDGARKRVWKVTNPLDFQPSEYHRSLFICNQPFISLKYDMPEGNKFEGLRMKAEARKAALEFLLEPAGDIFRSHAGKGELGGCRLHSALLQNMWRITKPSKVLIKSINQVGEAYEIKYGTKRRRIELDDDGLENADLILSDAGKVSTLEASGSENSNESFRIEEEQRPDDGEEGGKGRMDIKIFVYNDSNKKLKEKFGETDHDLDSRKSVCIVECKVEERDKNAIYQGACYACQEASRNLANLHFEPIYILSLCGSMWTYGILDFRGIVGLKNGKIDPASLPLFTKQQLVRFADNPLAIGTLETKLENSTRYYRERFSECPDAVYPTNRYLVGTLHLADEWYPLPAFGTLGGATQYGVHLLFEGLMRIIIGDKVIKWDKEDLEKAKELKDRIREADEELFWA